MSIVREIFGVIGFKDKASDPLNKVDKKMDGSKAKALGLQNAVKAIGGFMFVKQVAGMVGGLIELSANMEDTRVSFEVMLGSADKAKTMLDNLTTFADVTPFEPEPINDAAKMLLNFGISAEQILPSLQALGDVSMGNGEKFSRLSLAFGQVSSQGKLMGQDLLQMINAGFNPLMEISRTSGKSVAQLKEQMSKGLITFEMVDAAFKSATAEGGKFHGMMDKMSGEWHGLLSTVIGYKNAVGRIFGDMIIKALKPLLKAMIPILKTFIEWTKTERGMAIMKVIVVSLTAAFATLTTVIGIMAVKSALASIGLSAGLLPILGTVLPIIAALVLLGLVIEDVYTFFKGGDSVLGDWVQLFKDLKLWIDETGKALDNLFMKIPGLQKFNEYLKSTGKVNEKGNWVLFDIPKAIGGGEGQPTAIDKFIKEKDLLGIESWKNFLGITPKVEGNRAKGGDVTSGKSYIVGEERPEIFTPEKNGYIFPTTENEYVKNINEPANKSEVTENNYTENKQTENNYTTNKPITINTLVGEINITVRDAKEGAEKIKTTILDALNDLARNVFPAEAGVVI